VTQKTVPALPDAEQTELVTKMKPNTDYIAVVRTQCKVDPPAQGESGVLHGAESQSASFRVVPHREYAKQCAETGDFSTLISKRCVPCPTEAEGAQCILGLLSIREGHWMPSVSLVRAIEILDAKQTLFWKCTTSEACGSIPAKIEDGLTAVPRSVCGVGYEGPLCGACKFDDESQRFVRSGAVCAKCESPYRNVLALSAIIVGILLFAIYITAIRSTNRRVGEYGGIIRRQLFSYIQVSDSSILVPLPPPSPVSHFSL